MVTAAQAGSDFNTIAADVGTRSRIRYFTVSGATTGYDDAVSLTQSGSDVWLDAVQQPLSNKAFSADAVLMQQGRVVMDDSKVYVAGDINTSGPFKMQIGSPSGRWYAALGEGTQNWNIAGVVVYKKLYLRNLTTGSLAAE